MNDILRSYTADAPIVVDVDSLLLYLKPFQKARQYTKIKAYGNYFQVEDETFSRMQMYNSSFTSVFDVSITNAQDVLVNYVWLLKDILKLNYGSMCTPVIFLRLSYATILCTTKPMQYSCCCSCLQVIFQLLFSPLSVMKSKRISSTQPCINYCTTCSYYYTMKLILIGQNDYKVGKQK